MTAESIADKVAKIQDMKPAVPGGFNCIDFSLVPTNYGVRILLTFDRSSGWTMSTSVGVITPGVYTPLPLDKWTGPLRRSAMECAYEVMDLFNIDESTKRTTKGKTAVFLRFKECLEEKTQ